ARRLHHRLSDTDWTPFKVVPLPAPDLNIVCFAVGHTTISALEGTNDFADCVYAAMSVRDGPHRRLPEYFVTKTFLRADAYGAAAHPIVEALGFSEADYLAAGGLSVIRCTVMDPFL